MSDLTIEDIADMALARTNAYVELRDDMRARARKLACHGLSVGEIVSNLLEEKGTMNQEDSPRKRPPNTCDCGAEKTDTDTCASSPHDRPRSRH